MGTGEVVRELERELGREFGRELDLELVCDVTTEWDVPFIDRRGVVSGVETPFFVIFVNGQNIPLTKR